MLIFTPQTAPGYEQVRDLIGSRITNYQLISCEETMAKKWFFQNKSLLGTITFLVIRKLLI